MTSTCQKYRMCSNMGHRVVARYKEAAYWWCGVQYPTDPGAKTKTTVEIEASRLMCVHIVQYSGKETCLVHLGFWSLLCGNVGRFEIPCRILRLTGTLWSGGVLLSPSISCPYPDGASTHQPRLRVLLHWKSAIQCRIKAHPLLLQEARRKNPWCDLISQTFKNKLFFKGFYCKYVYNITYTFQEEGLRGTVGDWVVVGYQTAASWYSRVQHPYDPGAKSEATGRIEVSSVKRVPVLASWNLVSEDSHVESVGSFELPCRVLKLWKTCWRGGVLPHPSLPCLYPKDSSPHQPVCFPLISNRKYYIWPLDSTKYHRKYLWYFMPSSGQCSIFHFKFTQNQHTTYTFTERIAISLKALFVYP